jgi:hypothetical protein
MAKTSSEGIFFVTTIRTVGEGSNGDLGWWAKLWNRVLRFSIGHGYKPHRALYGMLFFLLVGAVFFQIGNCGHLITPSNNVTIERKARMDYPKFHAYRLTLNPRLPAK